MRIEPNFRIPIFEQAERAFSRSVNLECRTDLCRDDRQYEKSIISYFASFPDRGGLCYISHANLWLHTPAYWNQNSGEYRGYRGEIELPTDEDDTAWMIVYADGVVDISELFNNPETDEEWREIGQGFTTTIRSGVEVKELEEFYFSADCKKLNSSTYHQKKLSDWVDEVFLLIPRDGEFTLHEFQPKKLQGQSAVSDYTLDCLFGNKTEKPKAIAQETLGPMTVEGYGFWLSQKIDEVLPRELLGDEVKGKPDDLVLSIEFGQDQVDNVEYFERLEGLCDYESIYYRPSLVLRLKTTVSKMWFMDYLQIAKEAEGLVSRIFAGWRYLPRGLSRIEVSAPRSLNEQTADAIARREARSGYQRLLRDFMDVREPFDSMQKLYRRRMEALDILHGEYLDDIVAQQKPLPFFLEYPYRVYRRESDPFRKLRAGKRLLGVLAKVPLFLVLEDLLAIENALGEEVLSLLESNPPSDGTLAALHCRVAKDIECMKEPPNLIFQGLIPLLRNNRQLVEIVEKRNRLNHEPFDHEGFFDILDEAAPQMMESLRDALSHCRFIIPSGMRLDGDKKIVSAEDVCCSDSMFEKIEFETNLGLENFPSGELIAIGRGSEISVRLGRLVKTKIILQESYDFGVFDRVDKKEERHFVFLRADEDV